MYELHALGASIESLFKINAIGNMENAIDEVEPLVLRYRDAAKAQSEKDGREFIFAEFNAYHLSACLHEVLCLCTPRLGTPFPRLDPLYDRV